MIITAGGRTAARRVITLDRSEPVDHLADLYRTHHANLTRYAARYTRLRADAEDAVQDAFLVALTRYDHLQPANPAGWLYGVTRYCALTVHHRQARTLPAGDAIERTPEPPTETATTDPDEPTMTDPDTALYVLAALDELPPRQREALALWAFEGLSWRQVAERMSVKPATAKRETLRSLSQLRTR